MPSIPQSFFNFNDFIIFCTSLGLPLWGGGGRVYGVKYSFDIGLHPPFMVFVTQIMWCELNFQSVSNCVGFIDRMKFEAWRDFAMSRIAWGVTSVLFIFVSHRSSAFFRVIRLTVSWPNLQPIYMLDPWFLAIIILASASFYKAI
jgi:hypothetical protein